MWQPVWRLSVIDNPDIYYVWCHIPITIFFDYIFSSGDKHGASSLKRTWYSVENNPLLMEGWVPISTQEIEIIYWHTSHLVSTRT